MKTIPLSKKVLNIKGEPLKTKKPNPEWLALSKEEKKETKIEKTIETETTFRDYYLMMLGTRFKVIDKKETYWAMKIGMEFSEGTDAVELADDKVKFLRRLVEENKVIRTNQMGKNEEVELYFPYELGQILEPLLADGEKKEYGIEVYKEPEVTNKPKGK